MSDKKPDGDSTSYSAYGHLKKQVAQKNSKSTSVGSETGMPTVLKVFILGLILFSALLFSGVLTGPGPFGGDTSGDSEFQGDDIPQGDSNVQQLEDMCVNHGAGISQHYHYTVYLYIDDTQEPVPPQIGISDTCMKPIHTHDGTGKVHIELPSSYSGLSPNLDDFFGIWGYQFSSSQLLGQSGTVTMSVNGEEKTGQLQFYIPQDGDQIEIYLET